MDTQPQDQFSEAARAVLNTPQDRRERDLAEVINQLVETAHMQDSPEHAAFRREQAQIGQKISQEVDPATRAVIRLEGEAKAHLYAADLADTLGGRCLSDGQLDTARDMQKLGELHREIAGEIRNPTPPEAHAENDRPAPAQDFGAAAQEAGAQAETPSRPEKSQSELQAEAIAEFARDAAAASGLGPSARTIHVEQYPARDVNDIRSRAGGNDYSALRVPTDEPSPWRPENTMTRAITVGAGLGGATIVEINQDRPDVLSEARADPEAAERAESWKYERTATSSPEQFAEQEASYSRASSFTSSAAAEASLRETLASYRQDSQNEREAGGLEQGGAAKETGKGALQGVGY